MACIEMNLKSYYLGMDTSVNVILPESRYSLECKTDKKYPVVYVLHGFSDNYSAWLRKSTIEFIARDYEAIIVMPEVNNSFYSNLPNGQKYYDYITKELPIKIANFFPASTKKEDTYIMGNSMGGYGAFLIAMKNPTQYAAAVSFSGLLTIDSQTWDEHMIKASQMFSSIYEDYAEFKNSDNNLINLADSLNKEIASCPKLFHLCGTKDDATYEAGLNFVNYLKQNTHINMKYKEIPNGKHDWNTWNPNIKDAFEFFELKNNKSNNLDLLKGA